MFQLPEGFDFVPDHVVDVSPENSEYFERALLGGWNDVESLIGLVWSKEKQCAIALNFDSNPEELVFHVDANPFGKKDYEIEIVLNEEYVGTTTIVAGTGSGTLSLTKENGLLPGLNIVQFRTKTLTKAPPDTRLLGFALRRFEWK